MNKNEYPIFSGKVLDVPVIIEQDGEYRTMIRYLTMNDELTKSEIKEVMPLGPLSIGVQEHRDKLKQKLQDRVKIAWVPIRLDPSVIEGSEIRTCFGQINQEECGEGCMAKTYELEVIKARSQAHGDVLLSFAEQSEGAPHTGLRYIKILEEYKP